MPVGHMRLAFAGMQWKTRQINRVWEEVRNNDRCSFLFIVGHFPGW